MDLLKRKFSVTDVKEVVTKRTAKLTKDLEDKDAIIQEREDRITELELLKDIENPQPKDIVEPTPAVELYDAIFPEDKK